MNRERMERLRDAILSRELDVAFSMRDFIAAYGDYMRDVMPVEEARLAHTCGTVACIGGHAVALYDPEHFDHREPVSTRAQALLDLTDVEAAELFLAEGWYFPVDGRLFGDITREEAAEAVDRMLSGAPTWEHVADREDGEEVCVP